MRPKVERLGGESYPRREGEQGTKEDTNRKDGFPPKEKKLNQKKDGR